MASMYLPYHAESRVKARELVHDIRDPTEKYKAITNFVTRMFRYDYIRAIQIPKKNGLPDVDRCWNTKLGICLDIAAMTVGMLRAVGLKAYLCIGYADRQYHAWVETRINGKMLRYDHTGKAKSYKKERQY